MVSEYSISIYLDKRRAKSNGKYPVKLRVFTPSPRKQKLYPTKFDFTQKEFDSIWNTSKPRNESKKVRAEIQAALTKAETVAEKLLPFTFEEFERKLYRGIDDGVKLAYHYSQAIQELKSRNQLGNADTYELSKKSLKDFEETKRAGDFDKLTFYDITPGWLKDYEQYMVEDKGRSLTTVSMYVRVLRAITNKAIDLREIEKEFYPFGKRKYQVPAKQNVKKALTKSQLKTLLEAEPQSKEQEKAKDFWFFSYVCNGMNIKDIAMLRFKDIKDDKIEFIRAKTRNTSKSNLKPVTAYLNDYSKGIISKYGSGPEDGASLVFDIIQDGLTPKEIQTKVKNFTRFINQHIKKLCVTNDLPAEVSTYWARHSFATHAVRKGLSMEFIQESLGHGNISTTQNYFAGFDSETKREFANTLMNFD